MSLPTLIWCILMLLIMSNPLHAFVFSKNASGFVRVSLQRQGQFPLHHANGTLDFRYLGPRPRVQSHICRTRCTRLMVECGKQTSLLADKSLQEIDTPSWILLVFAHSSGTSVVGEKASSDCLLEPGIYDPDESGWAEATGRSFETTLLNDRQVRGQVWKDSFEIAGLVVPEVTFGVAVRRFVPASHHADGLCGMARAMVSPLHADGFFFEMIRHEVVDNEIFGLALARQGPSELSLGGVNARLFDNLAFMPLTGDYGYWEVEGFLIGGQHAFLQDIIASNEA
ncbi:hypothetical protein V8E36_001634 [Tilletia maclaganii]